MDISVDGSGTEFNITVNIKAQNYFGARHALESLSQMWGYDEGISDSDDRKQNGHFIVLDKLSIIDGPEFKHRGSLIDTSRNFILKAGQNEHP